MLLCFRKLLARQNFQAEESGRLLHFSTLTCKVQWSENYGLILEKKKPIRTKPFCKQFLSLLPYTLDILCGLNARFSFTLCWLPMLTINLPQLLYLFTYDKTSWIFQAVQHGPSIIETVLNYQKLREMITTILTSRYSLFWAI